MPPKAKITKEMILDTVLDITRQSGFDAVNARSIAARLHCSTRPLFTCYSGMDELKQEFLLFAYDFYERFVSDYEKNTPVNPCLVLPLSYLEFAKNEPFLFKLLFVSDMDLDLTQANDFYREIGNQQKAERFSHQMGLSPQKGKEVFLDLFLYTHGIAVLTATGKASFDLPTQEQRLETFLAALTHYKEVPHAQQSLPD